MQADTWSADRVADLLDKCKKSPQGWKGCCPAHEDRNPSLFLADGQDGLALVCYAGCTYKEVADALEAKGAVIRPQRKTIFEDHFQLGQPHSHWDYRNARGEVVMRICRWEQPGGKKDIRPLVKTADGWKWAHHPNPRPLFQLDRLTNEVDMPVLIVEGEKAAAAGQILFPDYIVTTWPGGAAATGQANLLPLADRDVTLIPDCDAPGRKAMAWLAKQLKDGIAKTVRTVDPAAILAALPEGWDLADALAEKRNIADLLKNTNLAPVDTTVRQIPLRSPLDWEALEGKSPPDREWVIQQWLPHHHPTLLAGRAGIGKTLEVQHLGTAMALAHTYLDVIAKPLKVLIWAGEDDEAELWRRQIPICTYFGVEMNALKGRLILQSYEGCDITLAAVAYGNLCPTPMMAELTAQVRDYGVDYVFLDNIARIYGGNESDRHSVTTFIAWLSAAVRPAGVCLLGHPAKGIGSEYSGSTAWEGAVRARLYLSDRLPDAQANDDVDQAPDPGVRYLSRRKSNYSPNDWRRLIYQDGVLVPEALDQTVPVGRIGGDFAKDIVRRAVKKLGDMGFHGNAGTRSPEYLPRLANQYGLLDRMGERQFGAVMRGLIKDGELTVTVVGKYSNRSPKSGLVLK